VQNPQGESGTFAVYSERGVREKSTIALIYKAQIRTSARKDKSCRVVNDEDCAALATTLGLRCP